MFCDKMITVLMASIGLPRTPPKCRNRLPGSRVHPVKFVYVKHILTMITLFLLLKVFTLSDTLFFFDTGTQGGRSKFRD